MSVLALGVGTAQALGGFVGTHAKGPISRALDQAANVAMPNEAPTVDAVLRGYLTGFYDLKTADRLARLSGVPLVVAPGDEQTHFGSYARAWNDVLASQRPQPALSEIIDLVNRGQWSEQQAHTSLIRQGFDQETVRRNLLSLRYEIPGVADLTRFAVRHVWEPDLIEYFGYDDEYRPAIEYWMGKQGFSYDARTPTERQAGRAPYTWGQAQWWSHWILPSPGQGYELLQRLRPERIARYRELVPGVKPFGLADLKLLLRANDYPPFWRDRLAAVSYSLPQVRTLAKWYQYGLIDRQELVEQYRDRGLIPDDAERAAAAVVQDQAQKRLSATTQGARGRVIAAYETGTMGRDQAAVQLYRLTFNDPAALAAFNARLESDQVEEARRAPGVLASLDLVDADVKAKIAKQGIATTRKMFLSGRIDQTQAQNRLSRLGVQLPRVIDLITLWTLELGPGLRELSTSQVMKYFREGLINGTTAATRLVNLGWQPADVSLLLASTQRDIALDLARAQEKTAQTAKQAQHAREAVVRAAREAHNRARSELARHGSPAMLKTWYTEGLIDGPTYLRRLAALDWTLDDAERALADAELARRAELQRMAAKRQKAAQDAAKGAPGTNGTATRPAPARKHGPSRAMLQKWYTDGIIDQGRFTDWLKAEGWAADDINALLRDIEEHGGPPAKPGV